MLQSFVLYPLLGMLVGQVSADLFLLCKGYIFMEDSLCVVGHHLHLLHQSVYSQGSSVELSLLDIMGLNC
jgi:hypothetical protein